jgi:hypothetical protein
MGYRATTIRNVAYSDATHLTFDMAPGSAPLQGGVATIYPQEATASAVLKSSLGVEVSITNVTGQTCTALVLSNPSGRTVNASGREDIAEMLYLQGHSVVVVPTITSIQAAWDALPSTGGVIEVGPGVPVQYVATQLLLQGKNNAKVIWPKSSPLLAPADATAPTMILIGDSTKGTSRALSANGNIGDITITVAAMTGLAEDQFVKLESTVAHQPNRIVSITGAGPYTIRLEVPLLANFTTAQSAAIVPFSAPMTNFELEGLRVDGNGNTGVGIIAVKMQACPFGRLTNIDGGGLNGALVAGTENYRPIYDCHATDCGSVAIYPLSTTYDGCPHFTRFDADLSRLWGVVLSHSHGWTGNLGTYRGTSRALYLAVTNFGVGEMKCEASGATGIAVTGPSRGNHVRFQSLGNSDCGLWFSNEGNTYNVFEGISRWNDPDASDVGGDLYVGPTDLHNKVVIHNVDATRLVTEAPALNWSKFNPVTFVAGLFTSTGGGTAWTLTAPDQEEYSWKLDGKKLTISFRLITTTVTGTPSALNIAFPAGLAVARFAQSPCVLFDNGVAAAAQVTATPAAAGVSITRMDGANFTASANNTAVAGQLEIEVS